MAEQTVTVGVGALSIEDVIAVARGGAKVTIPDESKYEMALSRAVIDHLADDTVPHYGISTGFGALASTSIPKEQRAQLQKSLIRSHAAGAGPEVEREVVRGLLVLRLSTLCTGRTGVRPETAQVYADMLNAGITPVVYEYGSLGCSGDLAPLAACALVAMGEGEARNADGRKIGGGEALRAAGITPVDLKEKEGLALVNGTDGMLGMLCMAIADLRLLLKTADVAAAMSVEGMLGNDRVFAADLQTLRPHRGQGDSAANIARMLKGSGLIEAAPVPPCACRTPTRCAAPRRCTAPPATLWNTRLPWRAWNSPPPSTTRASRWTAAWNPTVISMARRWLTCLIFLRFQLRTWLRFPSVAPTASSMWRATVVCRRSWPATRAWTPVS